MDIRAYWSDFPDMPIVQKWAIVKQVRTQRIDAIERLLHEGVPISLAKKQEIQNYIQILRDIPQTFENPDEVIFPEEPAYESI